MAHVGKTDDYKCSIMKMVLSEGPEELVSLWGDFFSRVEIKRKLGIMVCNRDGIIMDRGWMIQYVPKGWRVVTWYQSVTLAGRICPFAQNGQ